MISALRAPKIQMAIALIAIFLTSLLHAGEIKLLFLLVLSVAATIGSDFFFLKLRGKPLFFPSAAIVSGVIIALIVSPNLPWYRVFLPGLIAMFSKNFLRVWERHIFNPAAFGLFISGIILRQSTSWWGVSWQQVADSPLAFIILLTPFLVSALRMRRYFIQLSFLTSLALFKVPIFDPTVLFFAAVMLPEPMTTPIKPISQLAFGAAVALLSTINYFPDPLLLALLASNVLFFKLRDVFRRGGETMNTKVILGIVAALAVVGAAVVFIGRSGKNPYSSKQTGQPTQLGSPTPLESTTQKTESVALTSSGFEPQSITVRVGTEVAWTNKSGTSAAVNSANHPTHSVYPPLNLGSFGNGETFSLVFDTPGTYKYHNHLNPSQTAVVVVEE